MLHSNTLSLVATGTSLLSCALRLAAEDPAIASAHLHVHTNNTEAIAFYQRHGFHCGPVLKNYYRKLDPPDGVELYKALHVTERQLCPVACEGHREVHVQL